MEPVLAAVIETSIRIMLDCTMPPWYISGMTEDELLKLLRKECDESGGITAWAARHGLSRQLVHDILSGRRKVGNQVPRALGYKRMPTQYERIK